MIRDLNKYAAEVAVAARVGYSGLTATDSDGGTVPNQTTQQEEWLKKIKQGEREGI
jgi:hypothetical protein